MSAEPETKEPMRLFYDASCNLCHASMKKVKKWALDRGALIEVHTLQSPGAQAKGYGKDMIVEADGKVYRAGDAWLRVMDLAPWYLRWISFLRHNVVTATIAKTFYEFIARTRHFWFGRRQIGVSCPVGGG